MNNYDSYLETRKAIISLLDDSILSKELRADQVQQMLENLEGRYTSWADGRVPDDTFEDLMRRWRSGEAVDKSLHEFLCITEIQLKRWYNIRDSR